MWATYNQMLQRASSASDAGKKVDIGGGLTLGDIATTARGQWLNSEIMSQAFACVVRSSNEQQRVPVHIFSTFFMTRLWPNVHRRPHTCARVSIDYAGVRRQTLPSALRRAGQQRSNVFQCRYLIAPCNVPGHWTLVVADLLEQTFLYLDPMGVRGSSAAL